jgi:hypothetical protein
LRIAGKASSLQLQIEYSLNDNAKTSHSRKSITKKGYTDLIFLASSLQLRAFRLQSRCPAWIEQSFETETSHSHGAESARLFSPSYDYSRWK